MAQLVLPEKVLLYIRESPIRTKIMRHLSGQAGEYVSMSELAKSIGEKSGNVNFHCDRLHKEGLVDLLKTRRKYIRSTEKGLLVWQEVERRGKGRQKQ